MGNRNFECDPECYEGNCEYYKDCDYDWKVDEDYLCKCGAVITHKDADTCLACAIDKIYEGRKE